MNKKFLIDNFYKILSNIKAHKRGTLMTNKLNVLIVEDDENDCKALVDEINANSDRLCLAGALKSSNAALAFIRDRHPHAVILDLELQEGSGDGMDLLDKLRSVVVCPKPYIVVNTNSASKITRSAAKKMGADYEFAKWQKDYSPKMVIEQLLRVMPEILGEGEEPPAPPDERQSEKDMRDFLQNEFNNLGLRIKNKGYAYLVEAVILTAKGEDQSLGETICKKYGGSEDSVTHAMQYAIDNTWTHGDINYLKKYYTATLRKDRDSPTATEFIYYYKQQLLKYLDK